MTVRYPWTLVIFVTLIIGIGTEIKWMIGLI